MDDLYITLPSNASMDIYSANTMSHYTTKLAQRITFDGNWEVALVEIHLPQSWDNVDSSNNMFKYTTVQGGEGRGGKNRSKELVVIDKIEVIPHGCYESITNLLTAITSAMSDEGRKSIAFDYNENSRRVTCKIASAGSAVEFLSDKKDLPEMLGFTFLHFPNGPFNDRPSKHIESIRQTFRGVYITCTSTAM